MGAFIAVKNIIDAKMEQKSKQQPVDAIERVRITKVASE
jgi:hypothetical protein